MARCQCAGSSCSCLITAGAGVRVSGLGTNAAPYEISVDPTDAVIAHSAAGALDLSALDGVAVATVTLSANATSMILPDNGIRLDLIIIQDGSGGRTVAWPAGVRWAGAAPTPTASANARDWFQLLRANSQWLTTAP